MASIAARTRALVVIAAARGAAGGGDPAGPQVLRAISTDVFGNATISDRPVVID